MAPAARKTGLAELYNNRAARRDMVYRQLVREWEACRSSQVLKNLCGKLPAPLPEVPGILGTGSEGIGMIRAGALYGMYPEGISHSRQVARLAFLLFDALTPLHGYGGKERALLRTAGMLHDIGWVYGQKGHDLNSFRLIMDDRTLPVNRRERRIIALLAKYHRKNVPDLRDEDFTPLKRKDRERVCALASLLRIADGLDYTHTDRVKTLACTVTEDLVTCRPEYIGDGTVERDRALKKSDLFVRVFRRGFEIL